jgi:hypothetical protein
MRFSRAVLVLSILLAGVVLAPASPAWACSCARIDSLAWADSAFIGRVERVDQANGHARAWFTVESIAKGTAEAARSVSTSGSSASCGYEFEVGDRYRVFARDGATHLCSGTVKLEAAPASPTIRLTPESAAPPSAPSPSTHTPSNHSPTAAARPVSAPAGSRWAYSIGLLVLLSAGGVLLIRLRRRNE